MNYDEALSKLKAVRQEHILKHYHELEEKEQKNLLRQVEQVDFEYMNNLFYHKEFSNIETQNISSIEAIVKDRIDQPRYEAIGTELIKNRKLAICSMAGGQGTRLGFDGPKGTYVLDLGIKKMSIFETIVKKLRDAYTKYGVLIYWYVMTSHQNHEETVDFFEKYNYFGYDRYHVIFFQQGELPLMDIDGKVVMKDRSHIFMAPDGNGGIFKALGEKKILNHMKVHGIQYLGIGNVDNILIQMIDPLVLGLMQEKQIELASKSFLKPSPEGKWGVFCKANGRPMVIEYTETPKELLEARNEEGELIFGDAHFGCNFFHVNLLDKIVTERLPMHTAFKRNKILGENGETIEIDAYKFEAFIFDAYAKADDIIVFRVKQEDEFAPIKNKEGEESPETATKLYKQFYHIKEMLQ